MPAFVARIKAGFTRFRERHVSVDHAARTVTHYNTVGGNAQAGAVTFFGFLSFFPILALAFFFVGYLAEVLPNAEDTITKAVESFLPGVVGTDKGEMSLDTFKQYGGTVGLLGALGLLYSGLGWLSGMRDALETMFVLPKREQPNFLIGKARDLATLALLGLTLLLSVSLTGLVAGFSRDVLTWMGLDPEAFVPNSLLWLLGHGLAIVASTVLLMTMFKLLAQPHVPKRSLLAGAVVGAVGFELLKTVASYLIELTKSSPSFQAFGVSLILLVWINYFSRLVMYSAAYAYTSPAAVRLREQEALRAPAAPFQEPGAVDEAAGAALPVVGEGEHGRSHGRALAAGAALAAVGAVAVAFRHRERLGE